MQRALLTLSLLLGSLGGVLAAEAPLPSTPDGALPPAPPPPARSLLFTAEEAAALRRAMAHLEPGRDGTAAQTGIPALSLTAVMDLGGGRWTVWANNTKITPERQDPAFTVLAVRGDSVDFLVRNEPPVRVRLRPYQTWQAMTGQVVEGLVP